MRKIVAGEDSDPAARTELDAGDVDDPHGCGLGVPGVPRCSTGALLEPFLQPDQGRGAVVFPEAALALTAGEERLAWPGRGVEAERAFGRRGKDRSRVLTHYMVRCRRSDAGLLFQLLHEFFPFRGERGMAGTQAVERCGLALRFLGTDEASEPLLRVCDGGFEAREF